MKKVLFVYPPFSEMGFWNYKEVCGLMGAKYPAAPLGLITVAGLLPRDWSLKLIDMNADPLSDEDIIWADLVFIGGMLPQQKNILLLIKRIQALNKKVVVGGPEPTSQPELYKDADYLVLGEAELTLPAFLKDLEQGIEHGIYQTNEKSLMSQSPIPRYDLLNFKNYLMIGVQFCRGCPYNCEFCDIIELYGRVPRTKSPAQIIDELDTLYNLGYRGHIDFVDDNFIGNKAKVKEILQELKLWSKKRNYPFYYSTEASINLADEDELLSLMQELDFRYIFVGIESPNPEILKTTQKYHNTNRKISEDLKKIYAHGMVVNAGFIIGFDQETSESAQAVIDTIENGNIAMAMAGLLYALPNTQLSRRLEKEGRLLKQSQIIGENDVDQATTGINFMPTRPKDEILQDYLKIITTIYDDKIYFNRILRLARLLKIKPKHKKSFHSILISVRSLFRLICKIGIFSKRAGYFWRNTLLLLLTKISSLETAINLMAMHLHFKIQTQHIAQLMQNKTKSEPEKNDLGF